MRLLPSGLPEQIHDDEGLVRFLTSSSQFNSAIIKPAAFMPKTDATSVFRHASEPRDALWKISQNYLGAVRTVYGAATFAAHTVRKALLEIAAAEPPPRHADIIGWPRMNDPEMEIAQRKECAAVIAQYAQLIKRE